MGLVTVMRSRVEDRSLTAGRLFRREDEGEEPGEGEREDSTQDGRRRAFFLGRYCGGRRDERWSRRRDRKGESERERKTKERRRKKRVGERRKEKS